jgi:hypothetical protein
VVVVGAVVDVVWMWLRLCHMWLVDQDPRLCHQRLDTKSAILGRFRTRDFWRILYAKISDIPFWRLFVRKLYLTLLATIVVRRKVSNFKKSTFRPQK